MFVTEKMYFQPSRLCAVLLDC